MQGGLFVTLYNKETLKLYLNKGIFGFLTKPVMTESPSSKSVHYHVLADYACSREGCNIFFFLKRKIYYGGKIKGNRNFGSFYINGLTSPLGRKINANLFWDESNRYTPTETAGIFLVNNNKKSQPFIFQFETDNDSGKYISSDELYYKLGEYPYPLPSNSLQNTGLCTLTPGETDTLLELLSQSTNRIDYSACDDVNKNGIEELFKENYLTLDDEFVNEAQLEATILSSLTPFASVFNDDYVLCRQVPISPFKPENMDKADICLFSLNHPLKNGTIPNVIIELKYDKNKISSTSAYNQVSKYLDWIKRFVSDVEFNSIKAYVIGNKFMKLSLNKIDQKYINKIVFYSIDQKSIINLINH